MGKWKQSKDAEKELGDKKEKKIGENGGKGRKRKQEKIEEKEEKENGEKTKPSIKNQIKCQAILPSNFLRFFLPFPGNLVHCAPYG